ncbi:hypothetical protein QOT17_000856 [Balamuthia mandrillaris]
MCQKNSSSLSDYLVEGAPAFPHLQQHFFLTSSPFFGLRLRFSCAVNDPFDVPARQNFSKFCLATGCYRLLLRSGSKSKGVWGYVDGAITTRASSSKRKDGIEFHPANDAIASGLICSSLTLPLLRRVTNLESAKEQRDRLCEGPEQDPHSATKQNKHKRGGHHNRERIKEKCAGDRKAAAHRLAVSRSCLSAEMERASTVNE